MRINSENLDLKVCVAIASLLVLVIAVLPNSFIRVLLGLPFVLFLPGYVLVSVLFPRKEDLEGVERIALSFGLSIVVVPLMGMVLNFTPLGIWPYPILFLLFVFIAGMSLAAYRVRMNIPAKERFSISGRELGKISGYPVRKKALYSLLSLSIIMIVIVFYDYTEKHQFEERRFTEFYILDENMKAEDYPTDLTLGEEGRVIIGVVNHEEEIMNYTVVARLANVSIWEMDFTLGNGENITHPFVFKPNRTGRQRLEFLLYNGSFSEPYKSLQLWVNVRGRS